MNTIEKTTMKYQLKDILLFLNLGKLSKDYFGKSSSWFYNKLNGIDGNGGVGEFTDEEKNKLKNSLYDLADRLRKSADDIQ